MFVIGIADTILEVPSHRRCINKNHQSPTKFYSPTPKSLGPKKYLTNMKTTRTCLKFYELCKYFKIVMTDWPVTCHKPVFHMYYGPVVTTGSSIPVVLDISSRPFLKTVRRFSIQPKLQSFRMLTATAFRIPKG